MGWHAVGSLYHKHGRKSSSAIGGGQEFPKKEGSWISALWETHKAEISVVEAILHVTLLLSKLLKLALHVLRGVL